MTVAASAKKAKAQNGEIKVWEDDPSSGAMASAPRPDVAKRPLAYRFPTPAPNPDPDPDTAAFRYWTAAEALRRGSDFWGPKIKSGDWQVGPMLAVLLDEGEDLNAYYDRQSLTFFHGPSPSGTVYSGASPDIVCHELGHAILDTIKPQLWDAASLEAAAFHESFGDQCAILCALQLPSLRTAILKDTGGRLYRNSRLSRVAEQLGAAIRARRPDAVDPDCLRNAVNSFSYIDPRTLPSSAPASQLSSESHSFSRVFTGAFFEGLAGMLAAYAAKANSPTSAELRDVSAHMRDVLVDAIFQAPVVSNFFAQVAAGMIQASASLHDDYPGALKGAFVRRSILSLQSAATVQKLRVAATTRAAAARVPAQPQLDRVALPAEHYGLAAPLIVDTPSQPRQIVALAAAPDSKSIEPASAVAAATSFVDALFSNGKVDYKKHGVRGMALTGRRRLTTHEIVPENGAFRLARRLFDCGHCHK